LFAEDQEVDYRILYDREVDSVTIFYAPWASLHQRKLVDVYSYSHLKLIPANVFESRDMIFKVIWAIVNHRGTTEVSQL
jgi:hypothetical protein